MWARNGRPRINAANPGYRGAKFMEAGGKAAFVAYIRPILLRDEGACQNTIRLSVGTGHIDDMIADLEQAFQSVKEV